MSDIHELAMRFETHTDYAQNKLVRLAETIGRVAGELILFGQEELADKLLEDFADHREAQGLVLQTGLEIMAWKADEGGYNE